jgi:hypothetical protein
MKRAADAEGTYIICHEVSDTPRAAVCRGYYEVHNSQILQVAMRLDLVRFESAPGGG